MKNDDQMYQSVLSRRAAYRQIQENRRRTIRRITPVLACACLAVVLGVGYWNHFRNMPTIPTLPESSQALTTETTVETGSTEVPASESTEFPSTAATVPTETEPAATAETLLPTDATEPETMEGSAPESSAEASQQEPPHTDPPVTEQIQPSTQPPTEPTAQPATQEMTSEDTVTHETTVAPDLPYTEQDDPPSNDFRIYEYAELSETDRSYRYMDMEVPQEEIDTFLCYISMKEEADSEYSTFEACAYRIKGKDDVEYIAIQYVAGGDYLLYKSIERS